MLWQLIKGSRKCVNRRIEDNFYVNWIETHLTIAWICHFDTCDVCSFLLPFNWTLLHNRGGTRREGWELSDSSWELELNKESAVLCHACKLKQRSTPHIFLKRKAGVVVSFTGLSARAHTVHDVHVRILVKLHGVKICTYLFSLISILYTHHSDKRTELHSFRMTKYDVIITSVREFKVRQG